VLCSLIRSRPACSFHKRKKLQFGENYGYQCTHYRETRLGAKSPGLARISFTPAQKIPQERSTFQAPIYDRVWAASMETIRVMTNVQRILDTGVSVIKTGYLSILPVDQGMRTPQGQDSRKTRTYLTRQEKNIVKWPSKVVATPWLQTLLASSARSPASTRTKFPYHENQSQPNTDHPNKFEPSFFSSTGKWRTTWAPLLSGRPSIG